MTSPLSRLDVSSLPMPVEVRIVEPVDGDGDLRSPDARPEVVVSFVRHDTDSDHEIIVTMPGLPIPPGSSDDQILEIARVAIRWAMLHEVDEWLLVDGVRRWDPHPVIGGRRSPFVAVDAG